jgi:hypothetical protein
MGYRAVRGSRSSQLDRDGVIFLGHRDRLWLSRPAGVRFAAAARGRSLNLQCEVEERTDCATAEVGIDLGLATLATFSTCA